MFYIDATTCETISAGLTTLAKGANVGKSQDAGLAWLVSRKERWLLVFDNADDPKLNLHEFFPACTHGDILITTRNQQMRAHTQEPNAYCSVAGMLPEDALTLMLKASGVGGDEHEAEAEIHIAKKLIRVRPRIRLLTGVALTASHRNLATLRLQLYSLAHICVPLSVG